MLVDSFFFCAAFCLNRKPAGSLQTDTRQKTETGECRLFKRFERKEKLLCKPKTKWELILSVPC